MNYFKSAVLSLPLVLLVANCGMPPSDRFLGNPAPNFRLVNLAGEEVELSRVVNQKPTLLVFWATWCPTCVEEVPTLNEWSQAHPGLQILAIDVQEPAGRVKTFAKKHGIRYPVLLDPEADVAHQYDLVGIPAAILLARGGKVIYYGFALPENIEQLIKG